MPERRPAAAPPRRLFLLAAVLQVACGLAFLVDAISEWSASPWHVSSELLAVLALWSGAGMTLWGVARLINRNIVIEEQLSAATGAFHGVVERKFEAWGLTPSERDVAILAIKGLTTAEIASARATREGTIRAQQAAIYRKAGVSGRPDLLSHFIEEIAAGLPVPAVSS